jgi:hypothetical protein
MSVGLMRAAAAILRNVGSHLDAYRDYSRAKEVGDVAASGEQANMMGQILAYYAQQKALDDYIGSIGGSKIFDPQATGETARRTAVGGAGQSALAAGGQGMDRAKLRSAGTRLGRSANLDALRSGWGQGMRGYSYPATEYMQDTAYQQNMLQSVLQDMLGTYGARMEVAGTKLGHTEPISDHLRQAASALDTVGSMGGGGGGFAGGGGPAGMAAGMGSQMGAGSGMLAGGAGGYNVGGMVGQAAGQYPAGGGMDWSQLMKLLQGYAGTYSGGGK